MAGDRRFRELNAHEVWTPRPRRIAGLVLGLLSAVGLLALVWGVAFAPIVMGLSRGHEDAYLGLWCGASLPLLLLLAWALSRCPNVPGAGLAVGFAGLFAAFNAVMFPLAVSALLLGADQNGIGWGFFAGAVLFGVVVWLVRRLPMERQARHGTADSGNGGVVAAGGIGAGFGGFGDFGGGAGGGYGGGGGGC